MPRSDKSLQIITETLLTSQTIGPKKTLEAIIAARTNAPQLPEYVKQQKATVAIQKHNETLVINTACDIFNITPAHLLKTKCQGDRIEAMILVCGYFKTKFKYSLEQIKDVLDRDVSRISRFITDFGKLSSTNKIDKPLLDKYALLLERTDKKLKTADNAQN